MASAGAAWAGREEAVMTAVMCAPVWDFGLGGARAGALQPFRRCRWHLDPMKSNEIKLREAFNKVSFACRPQLGPNQRSCSTHASPVVRPGMNLHLSAVIVCCGAATCCACRRAALTGGNLPHAGGSPRPRRGANRMNQLLLDYLPLVVFMGVALAIGLALMVAPFLVAVRNPDPEKVSAYECGFNAFDDARMKFDVRFYLVSILFIIFDLEVAFLFPWAVAFKDVGAFGFWSMMVFLAVLTVGFIYEWRKGALEWD